MRGIAQRNTVRFYERHFQVYSGALSTLHCFFSSINSVVLHDSRNDALGAAVPYKAEHFSALKSKKTICHAIDPLIADNI